MKTLKEIRDALERVTLDYEPHNANMDEYLRNAEDAIIALDTIIASIPDGLGEALVQKIMAVLSEVLKNNEPDIKVDKVSSPYYLGREIVCFNYTLENGVDIIKSIQHPNFKVFEQQTRLNRG
jgi:hypothetical protein